MSEKMIRAFIAVPLPPAVQQHLGAVGERLAAQVPPRSVRWVKPERMHLTLRFLGDTAVAHLPAITQALDRAVAAQAAFDLRLHELGCFPNRRRPRVIWVGLDGNQAALAALKQRVDAALQPLGWDVEKRPFRAHLTLGRVKESRLLADLPWGVPVEKKVVPVTAVDLIKSQLRPSGPIYTQLHAAHLQTA